MDAERLVEVRGRGEIAEYGEKVDRSFPVGVNIYSVYYGLERGGSLVNADVKRRGGAYLQRAFPDRYSLSIR